MNIFKKIWSWFFPKKEKGFVIASEPRAKQSVAPVEKIVEEKIEKPVEKKAKHLPSFSRRKHSRTHIGEKWIAVKRTIGWQYKDDMPEALLCEYSVKHGYRTYRQGAFSVIAKNIKRANQAFERIPHI